MRKIYLIRHTQPDIEQGRIYGQSDLGLVDTHPEEMLRVAGQLGELPQDTLIYSSPLQRCHLLAKFLKEHYQVHGKILLKEGLAEIDFGDWEMKMAEEIGREALKQWRQNFVDQPAPGGESFSALNERATEAFQEILDSSTTENVLITAHGGSIRCIISHVLGVPLQNIFNMHLDYGAVNLVTFQEKGLKLMFMNR